MLSLIDYILVKGQMLQIHKHMGKSILNESPDMLLQISATSKATCSYKRYTLKSVQTIAVRNIPLLLSSPSHPLRSTIFINKSKSIQYSISWTFSLTSITLNGAAAKQDNHVLAFSFIRSLAFGTLKIDL